MILNSVRLTRVAALTAQAVVVPATLLQISILRKHAIHGIRAVEDYLQSGRHAARAKMLTSRSEQMRHTVWSLALEAALILLATLSIVRRRTRLD